MLTYFESKSYNLTWFFGHLLEQLKPDEYDEKYKEWKMEHLPIIPEKTVFKYKGASQKNQGQTILFLCQQSDQIICGTDPDREGQGIFDTYINYYKIKKPTKRLWATSLTEKDLIKAWGKMKDIEDYKLLSISRELRADSDWYVGMNASRAYTIIGNGNLPVGRVLTATLALIVRRDYEVENYKEGYYYQLKGLWNRIGFTYFDESGTKFENKEHLDKIRAECIQKIFSLNEFKSEEKIENPPKTFNLPDLQKEANKRYGYSLDKTLELAQSLYEKKLTTYPRTDSPFLPESDLIEYHELVRKVARKEEIELLRTVGEKPASVKDTESPHTALIVTGESLKLTDDEEKLYELIRSRFVCAFMQPRKYQQYDIIIDEGAGNKFKAVIRKDIEPGFRSIYKEDEKEDDIQEINSNLSEMEFRKKEDKINALSITTNKKPKPKYYTPATLITAMQTCGRTLENEKARKILAETKGIGTPATQALYPKQLEKYQYISVQKGFFISNQKGRLLIDVISPDLKSPELTADWEMKLKLIESGKISPESYKKELKEYICKIISDAKERQGKINLKAGEETSLKCPQCRDKISKMSWGHKCNSCDFSISSKISEKTIPEKEIEKLILKGETNIIKGFKSKDKKTTFEAKLVLNEENGKKKVQFVFENIICPKCKKGIVRFFEWGAACSDREKCSLKVSKEIAHKKITDAQLKSLIQKGSTEEIKGFKSREKSGEFNAKIVFDKDYNIKFDFSR
jgi:DNA topoisomerase-3